MSPQSRLAAFAASIASGIAALVLGLAPLPAPAQQPPQDQQDDEDLIVVTGTYIRQTDQGALPVQVIDEEQIRRTGATDVEQLLRNVTSSIQGNNNVVAATVSGSNTAGVSGASLRGLGSQRTLVLINGRRSASGGTLTDSTTVDVNTIPLSAVERVEVLKDGASAVYGSDAIGGVINFILRRDFTGADLDLFYGDTSEGGAVGKRAAITAGWGTLEENRMNLLFTASYQRDEPLIGGERDFARSGVNVDALNDTTSGNSFPANIVIPVGGGAVTLSPNYPNCAPAIVSPLFDAILGPGSCRYDPSELVTLLPEMERTSLYGAARFGLTSAVQAYAEASFTHKRQRTIIQGSPVSDQFALPPEHPLVNLPPYNDGTPGVGFATIVLSPSSEFYPTAFVQGATGGATPDVLVRYRTVNIGNRDFTDISDVTRGAVGLQGTLGAWDFDVPLLYSKTKLDEQINGGISLYTRLLPLLNSGRVNFFGPNTPEVQAELEATQFIGRAYTTDTSLMSIAPTIARELLDLPAGALAFALGAEFRREEFSTEIAPELEIGDTTHYGGSNLPVDVERDVASFFAELSVPIVPTLTASAAVRYDDYENTGNKTTPKVSLRWQPVDALIVRASFGKGFRAPSLSELHQPQITGVSAPGLSDPLRCGVPVNGVPNNDARDCLTQFNIILGGNTELQPEESDNYTLGVVFRPLRNLSVSLDAYRVNLQDTIIFGIDPGAMLDEADTFADFIIRGPEDPATPGLPGHIIQINQINLNFGETKVQGIDVGLFWRLAETPFGTFSLAVDGTYLDKFDVQNLDGSFRSVAGKVSPIVNGAGGATPRWHHYLSLGWQIQDWEVAVAQNFQSRYDDIPGTLQDTEAPDFVQPEVGSYLTHDVQVTWRGIRQLTATIGAKNVFDRDPPYSNVGGFNYFQAGYDPGYADPRGRFYYMTLRYDF